ncbi:flagellin [Sulfurihydrogenibium azorense]|uniref:flagellin N-terminal helical domain-containing protein n=1 Tax=Sulfurihydrogenibium azorense TaxID=309806 RepID=UPI00240A3866|nr:flagellin [Sulfurihydrogenibium azorense]MDM7273575.1 flagellin [Sulfurihydrogenibium azorense]
MRIADLIKYDNYIKNDQIRQNEIEKYSKQIATGKKLISPSDDTVATVSALRLKTINQDIERYSRNMDFVLNVLDSAETQLNSIVEAGQEVRVEIVRLLNTGVLDKEDAKVLRDYFVNMKDYIIKQANFKIGDTALFGGVKTQTDPFASDGTYQGETVETKVPVAPGVELNTTFNGKIYLGVNNDTNKMILTETIDKIVNIIDNAISGTGSLGDLNTATISVNGKNVKLLEAFDIGLNTVMQYRSVIGTQVKTIQDLKTINDQNKVFNNDLISKLEDVDAAEAITNLQKAQVAYQALISVFNQNRQLSLLDFFK